MDKGFMLGVVVGATAAVVYGVGMRAKDALDDGKEKIKKKLENILD